MNHTQSDKLRARKTLQIVETGGERSIEMYLDESCIMKFDEQVHFSKLDP